MAGGEEERMSELRELSSCEWKASGLRWAPVTLYERHIGDAEGSCGARDRGAVRPRSVAHLLAERPAIPRCVEPRS